MSARDELLAAHHLGPAGADLLYRLVGMVGVAHRFPPPDGATSWDSASQQTAAHIFIEDPRTPKRLLDIAIRSLDDRGFERQLEKAILNHFRDLARATDLGKLIVRVKEVLRETDDFVAVSRRGEDLWTLSGHPSGASPASAQDLAAAIRLEPVAVPRWNSATRDAPLAHRDTLIDLIRLVLKAAQGGLVASEIARTLATRLDNRRVPLTVELDSADGRSEPPDISADPANRTVAIIRAAEILAPLRDRQRIILLNLELSARELGNVIGTGKSQAALLRQQLVDHLVAALEGDEDQEGTARALTDLCNHWITQRTADVGGTS